MDSQVTTPVAPPVFCRRRFWFSFQTTTGKTGGDAGTA